MTSEKKRLLAGIGVAVLAVAFIAYGVSRGEMATVLAKATKICMECIGLG